MTRKYATCASGGTQDELEPYPRANEKHTTNIEKYLINFQTPETVSRNNEEKSPINTNFLTTVAFRVTKEI